MVALIVTIVGMVATYWAYPAYQVWVDRGPDVEMVGVRLPGELGSPQESEKCDWHCVRTVVINGVTMGGCVLLGAYAQRWGRNEYDDSRERDALYRQGR